MNVRAPILTAREYADRCGLTDEQIAKRFRAGVGYVRQLIRHGVPSITKAERLARIIGCPVDAFLRRAGEPAECGSRPRPTGGSPRAMR